MFDLKDTRQAYEVFRLQWMIDHGYSILAMLKNLEAMIEEDPNESGVNEDITMLDALQRLWHHKAKRKSIRFEITFDDVSRKVIFGKVWSRLSNDWNYYVKDGEYTPQYVYGEKQIVSAIMSISGMSLFGNTVRYHIHQR